MLKPNELRDQSVEDLEATLLELRQEVFKIKNEIKETKKVEKPHLFQEIKKDIARILTILGEKKQQAKLAR